MALKVGQPAPDCELESHLGKRIQVSQYFDKCNVVLVFFPLAWTPIWTSQIPSYQADLDRFDGVQTQVLGLSVDSVPCLTAWAESLGGITYPLLSDFYPHGRVAESFGVLRSEGYSERAIFVVDRQGIIRYIDVHDIEEQPDNEELFRVLAGMNPGLPGKKPALPTSEEAPSSPDEPNTRVTLYCTPWCPTCNRARAYLKERHIPYVEIDISRDRTAAQRVRGWANGYETTPTIDVNGTIIVNFDRAKLEKALARQ